MDGPAFDVTELPPKRGAPPKFRRNRVATIGTLCLLGFAAGMGVQWGMLHRSPPSAPPANSEPKRALVPTTPRKHAVMTMGSDAPGQAAIAPVETAAATPPVRTPPATGADPAPLPSAPSVGLSRDALDYGRRAEAQTPAAAAQPASAPVQVASLETPPAPAPETKPAPAPASPARAKATARKTAPTPPRPEAVRVSAETPSTRPLADRAPGRPSFDCSRATSPGERQVCRNPSLAELDARMDFIYRRALSSARDPRALKADQDRWMAVREGAALRDPTMVGPAYERRIAELSRRDW